MDGISIVIPLKKGKKNSDTKSKSNNIYLKEHIEIKKDCLKYFYGCWIKCIRKKDDNYNSGGFLTKLCSDTLYLRTIQSQELIEFMINDYKFYVKENNEQYIGMQQIELEKEKNKIESVKIRQKIKNIEENEKKIKIKYKIFEDEKLKFEKIKEKFFKLFENGKVKITV